MTSPWNTTDKFIELVLECKCTWRSWVRYPRTKVDWQNILRTIRPLQFHCLGQFCAQSSWSWSLSWSSDCRISRGSYNPIRLRLILESQWFKLFCDWRRTCFRKNCFWVKTLVFRPVISWKGNYKSNDFRQTQMCKEFSLLLASFKKNQTLEKITNLGKIHAANRLAKFRILLVYSSKQNKCQMNPHHVFTLNFVSIQLSHRRTFEFVRFFHFILFNCLGRF